MEGGERKRKEKKERKKKKEKKVLMKGTLQNFQRVPEARLG
jgi:hypothetical protein